MMHQRNRQRDSDSMALSLHIGLNAVDPAKYDGWPGTLVGCEPDAKDLAVLALSQGFEATVLLTRRATRDSVLSHVRQAAKALDDGGFLWISYSGHGGQVPDRNGDELDKMDETWCLYDGQLIDDELTFELTRFKRGVRVLVTTDCCHSGTVMRSSVPIPVEQIRVRMMPVAVAIRVYREHQAFYDKLKVNAAKATGHSPQDADGALARVTVNSPTSPPDKKFEAAIILMAGCQENQLASETDSHGLFTGRLLQVWDSGAFRGTYTKFNAAIGAGMPFWQSPMLLKLGRFRPFLAQKPFSVEPALTGRSVPT